MNYEQKYKEALERAKTKLTNEVAADIFPELNEDEKIRKALMQNLKERFGTKGNMGKGLDMPHVLAWLEKQGEQKPAWREEDETTKNNISHIIRQYDKISKREKEPCWYIGDCLLWMQNIKDRVQPQPMQEWSEEDESMLFNVIRRIELLDHYWNKPTDEKMIDWLKSLRPQSHWKPTDEQIKVLNEVINFAADHGTMRWNDYIYNVLKSLREQLKNL